MPDHTRGEGVPDDQPSLGEAWETDWPDEMDSQDKVEAVAETLRQPRSAQWIAERAEVSPKTARKYLERFVERGEFVTEKSEDSGATLYAPDPERKMIDHVLELADRGREELTELRMDIANDIEEWQEEFDVGSPDELRLTIDESLSVTERHRRRKIAHRWESRKHLQSMTEVAMMFREHTQQFSTTVSGDDGTTNAIQNVNR